MIKPVYYLQGDSKWGNHNYSAKGEHKTISSSGCGPTSAAMIVETLRPDIPGAITPVDAAEWSMEHGYKFFNQGTAYAFFTPYLNKYNIKCTQMNTSNNYHSSSDTLNKKAKALLEIPGYFLICCMGVGNWTSGGHYVVAYGIDENNNVYINDPASKGVGKAGYSRIKAPWSVFKKEVKYYWSVKWGINYKIKGTNKSYKLYKSHDSTSGKLQSIKSGSDIWIIRDLKDGWSLAATDKNVGYVKNSVVNAVGLSAYNRVTLKSNVNVHEKNSKISSVTTKLSSGSEVKIVTMRKNWTNVICPNKTSGWIATKYIKEVLGGK